MTKADMNFIAKQNERLLTEVLSLRDDMNVLSAIVIRQDGTLTAMLQEIRDTDESLQQPT